MEGKSRCRVLRCAGPRCSKGAWPNHSLEFDELGAVPLEWGEEVESGWEWKENVPEPSIADEGHFISAVPFCAHVRP